MMRGSGPQHHHNVSPLAPLPSGLVSLSGARTPKASPMLGVPGPPHPEPAAVFYEPVPMEYPLCEGGGVCFTWRDQPGVNVSECIRTNYANVDNGHFPVNCFSPYRRIPWALMVRFSI